MLRISARGLLMWWVWAEVSCQLTLPCRAADPAFGSQLSPAISMHRWAFGFGFFCFSGSCTPCTRGTESLTAVPPEVFNWFPSAPGLSRRTDVCPVHEDFAWFCHGGLVAWVALGDRPSPTYVSRLDTAVFALPTLCVERDVCFFSDRPHELVDFKLYTNVHF